jgi:hypothetical protein
MAHVCGLGYLLDSAHVRTTLKSILQYNFQPMSGYFNNMRSYALSGEAGLVLATYSLGRDQKFPFPYFNEIMTGFKYSTIAHIVYEGIADSALVCVDAIRSRYDGEKRNPFNEIEAGYHYARAMASWALVPAYAGFHYSVVDKSMEFAPRNGSYFFLVQWVCLGQL